jgi:DNA mismatch repair protein MutS
MDYTQDLSNALAKIVAKPIKSVIKSKTAKTNIVDQYIDYQEYYESKYGIQTRVLMQVGDFFECYSIVLNCPKLKSLSDMLNISMTRKNKEKIEINRSNPHMLGFPIHALRRFLDILTNNNYTIPLIEQTDIIKHEHCSDEIVREITNIYSPGTLTDIIENADSNNLCSIYLDTNKCILTNRTTYMIGLSTIELSTGYNSVYDFHSTDYDIIMTDLYQLTDKFSPREIVIVFSDKFKENESKTTDVQLRLSINNRYIHCRDIDREYYKLSYQNELLRVIFSTTGILSPIEYIDLENKLNGLISYISLLVFVKEHNPLIIQKINKPIILNNSIDLKLHNNTLLQLNVIENKSLQVNTCYKSLFHVVNKTATAIGKRHLKYLLVNPIYDVDVLNSRYNMMDLLMNSGQLDKIRTLLNSVSDIERLHRKLSLGKLHPFEFGSNLVESYKSIRKILIIVNDIGDMGEQLNTTGILNKLNKYMRYYNRIFNVEVMCNLNTADLYRISMVSMRRANSNIITSNLFKQGVYPDVEDVQTNIININNWFDVLSNDLSIIVDKKTSVNKTTGTVKRDFMNSTGHFLTTTLTRGKLLINELQQLPDTNITQRISNGTMKDVGDLKLEFRQKTGSTVLITSSDIRDKSSELLEFEDNINKLLKEKLLLQFELMYTNYNDVFSLMTEFISIIDILQSNCRCAMEYGYVRPVIVNNDISYIKCVGIRHPIIERLNNDILFVSNDISLGIEHNGILLTGLNLAGKSTLMRSIGLTVIMAQSGMYVPCSSMEFMPYRTLFTRINGDDNLFNGQSTFNVEMIDLRGILNYSNNHSLILADELCKGTEVPSAIGLVAASVITLIDKGANFLFTTHLHELTKLSRVNTLEKLRFCHLHVECGDAGELIYDRKIRNGPGKDIYGIEVARSINIDINVINLAMEVRNDLSKIGTHIIKPKQSRYNAEVWMHKCIICNITGEEIKPANLETHHIHQQKDANACGVINIADELLINKNSKGNLIVVCRGCHQRIHAFNDTGFGIKLMEWKFTSNGPRIEYDNVQKNETDTPQINKKGKYKFTVDELNTIIELKNTVSVVKGIGILKQNGINISTFKLRQLWK